MDFHDLLTRRTEQVIDPRGVQLFAVAVTFLIIVWLFFTLRMLVKLVLIKSVSLDDWLMIFAVIIFTTHAAITVWGIVGASTERSTDYRKGESIALHSWFIDEILYAPLSALIRSSIAVFLLRIATVKLHRMIIYGSLIVTWVLSLAYLFIMLFQCWPVSHFYEQVVGQAGTCMNQNVVPIATIVHSVISALTDCLLALLPVAILWNVRLNKRTKIGIAALLSLGILAGIALVIRIPYVRFEPISSPDFLDQATGTALWSVMETSLGIIAGCAATMRPLLGGFGPKSWTKGGSAPSRRVRDRPTHPRSAVADKPPVDEFHSTRSDFDIAEDLAAIQTRRQAQRTELGPSRSSLSAVHIKTSIEVKRERQSKYGTPTRDPLRTFPSHGGDRMVTINGKGLSDGASG